MDRPCTPVSGGDQCRFYDTIAFLTADKFAPQETQNQSLHRQQVSVAAWIKP